MQINEKNIEALSLLDSIANEAPNNGILTFQFIKKTMADAKLQTPWKILNKLKNSDGLFDLSNLSDNLAQYSTEASESTLQASSKTNTNTVASNTPKKRAKKRKQKKINLLEDYKNPVFHVEGIDSGNNVSYVGITTSFETAWKLRENVLHDNGKLTKYETIKELKDNKYVYICSSVCNTLFCKISIQEILD